MPLSRANQTTRGTLIASAEASNDATVEFVLTGDYASYILVGEEVEMSAGTVTPKLRFSTNGGTSWLTTSYTWSVDKAGTKVTGVNVAAIDMFEAMLSELSFEMNIIPSPDATKQPVIYWRGVNGQGSGNPMSGGGSNYGTTAIDAVQFYFSANNVGSGRFRLYGVKAG